MGVLSFLFLLLFVSDITYAQNEVKIGSNIWMTKNLDVTTFRNGDKIPEAKSREEWIKAGEEKKPAWCYYDNKVDKINGRLYNFYAVTDPRGLAPIGWEIPSSSKARELIDSNHHLSLQSKNWGKVPCKSCNSTSFNALPNGCRVGERNRKEDFYGKEEYGFWWTSTDVDTNKAGYFCIYSTHRFVKSTSKVVGLAVRCVKDEKVFEVENNPDRIVRIGDYFQGGIVFHLWKESDGKLHGLIIDTKDLKKGVEFTSSRDTIRKYSKTLNHSDGFVNSRNIARHDHTFTSASLTCMNSNSKGYRDWYLPSIDEFLILESRLEIINNSLSNIQNGELINSEYWTSNLDNTDGLKFYYYSRHVDSGSGTTDFFSRYYIFPDEGYFDYRRKYANIRAIRKF